MARGVVNHDSMDSWLGHNRRGSRGKFLSKWKDKGSCDTWLHTKRLPLEVYRHAFPMFEIIEDKITKEKEKRVFNKRFVCHEDQEVLENPWRDKVTGERENPPQRCGLCKLDEWLWQQCLLWMETHVWDEEKKAWKVAKGETEKGLDPCAPMFKFISEASDDKKRASESIVLYVGGVCNFIGRKDIEESLAKAVRAAKIRLDEVFKQNAKARCESVLCVVDNDNIQEGVQIAVETEVLGTLVKEEIKKTWKSMQMNIQKTPFCIQWEYHKDKKFSERYSATALLKLKPSERVLKLIRGEAPDLSKFTETFNQQSMRAVLEKYCLIEGIPWKELFPSPEQEKKWAEEDEELERDRKRSNEEEEDEEETSEESDESNDSDDDDSDDEQGDDDVACDKCGKAIKLTDAKCKHCGHEYETTEKEEEPPKKEKKLLSRAELAKKKSSASTKKKSKDDDDEEDPKDVPF